MNRIEQSCCKNKSAEKKIKDGSRSTCWKGEKAVKMGQKWEGSGGISLNYEIYDEMFKIKDPENGRKGFY